MIWLLLMLTADPPAVAPVARQIPESELSVPLVWYGCWAKDKKKYDGIVAVKFEHSAITKDLKITRSKDGADDPIVGTGQFTGATRTNLSDRDEWVFAFKGTNGPAAIQGKLGISPSRTKKGSALMWLDASNVRLTEYECLQGPRPPSFIPKTGG